MTMQAAATLDSTPKVSAAWYHDAIASGGDTALNEAEPAKAEAVSE